MIFETKSTKSNRKYGQAEIFFCTTIGELQFVILIFYFLQYILLSSDRTNLKLSENT
jgi:hypothetical protein